MATLAELSTLYVNSEMRNKVSAAAVIKATATITDATAPAARKEWAERTLTSTASQVDMLWKFVLGQNHTETVSTILSANDPTVQTAVNNAIDAVYPAA